MINVVLGNGLEGYGVVNYAINIVRALISEGFDAQLIAYPTGKYAKHEAFDLHNVPTKKACEEGDIIFVSLPYTPEQLSVYKKDIQKHDGNVSIFQVDRNVDRVRKTMQSLPVIPKLSSIMTFETDTNYIDWQSIVGKTNIIPNHTLAVFEEDFVKADKHDMLMFTGRFSQYKQPELGIELFYRYFMANNWSYAHAASLPHIEVKKLLSIASAGVFASEWRGMPVVENALIEMIASDTVPIMPSAAAIAFAGDEHLSRGVVSIADIKDGTINANSIKELSVDKTLLKPYAKEAVAELAINALNR